MVEKGLPRIWRPKQVSGVGTDLTRVIMRGRGMAAGLVDLRIACVGASWSGLRIARKR